VAARADEAPEVAVELAGIGSAVTPDALIPATGGIKDDYGVKQVAFRVGVRRTVKVGEDATKTVPGELGWLGLPARRFPVKYGEEELKGVALDVDTALDLRAKRSSTGGGFVVEPNDTLILSVIARDGLVASLGGPNVGVSEEYRLKVVTPEELVARLDADELGQRRRFEQNIRELREMRDSLLRLQTDMDNGPTGGAAGLSDTPEDSGTDDAAERFRRLQLLRSQSAIQASAKQRQEIEGISSAFKDIRLELINNRIDNDERKRRIKEQIYEPLDTVTGTMYPELEQRLARLAEVIEDAEGDEAAQQSIDQSEEILVELESILQKMLDLETFNELVELLREMIKEQEELTEDTKRQRSRTLRDLE
jgi:hypothetical protein